MAYNVVLSDGVTLVCKLLRRDLIESSSTLACRGVRGSITEVRSTELLAVGC